jgi:uncharacterized BrkB/YihY/UPF0761 family membrane protein
LTTNKERPDGITVISILIIIGGIFLIAGGISLIGLGTFLSVASEDIVQSNDVSADLTQLASLGTIPLVIGAILLILGIAYLIVSYGLLKGKGWAWVITIIVTVIGLIVQIISAIIAASITSSVLYGLVSHIVGIFISGVIIYYMFRPNVKAFYRQ